MPKGFVTAVLALSPEKAEVLLPWIEETKTPAVRILKRPSSREWSIDEIAEPPKSFKPPQLPDVDLVLYRLWGIRPPEAPTPKE